MPHMKGIYAYIYDTEKAVCTVVACSTKLEHEALSLIFELNWNSLAFEVVVPGIVDETDVDKLRNVTSAH
jgi:hypothetical protein